MTIIVKHIPKILFITLFCSMLSITAAERRPILFVHGWTGAAVNWDQFKQKFIQDGWPSERLFARTFEKNSDLSNGANERNARQIADWVKEIRTQTKATSVDLVSHSMGGLSTRYFIKFLGGDTMVAHYISLATPQHGTTNPKLIDGDMNTQSDFLKKINQGDPTPRGVLPDTGIEHLSGTIHWTSIYSATDAAIPPWQTAILNGANNYRIDIGHLDFLTHQSVYEWIKLTLLGQTASIKPAQQPTSGN